MGKTDLVEVVAVVVQPASVELVVDEQQILHDDVVPPLATVGFCQHRKVLYFFIHNSVLFNKEIKANISNPKGVFQYADKTVFSRSNQNIIHFARPTCLAFSLVAPAAKVLIIYIIKKGIDKITNPEL